MKLSSVSGIVFYVKDISATADFYTGLGFRPGKQDESSFSCYVNWFWMDFHQASTEDKPEFKADALAEPKGAGQYLYIKVEDVNGFYQEVTSNGYKPSSEPRDWPWGNREFVLRDPDGYKLVFFQKIKG